MSKPVIVCVDDEKFVLDSLRTTLAQAFGEDYLIEIAEDGADALELVRDLLANGQEVPVVISDYVMPRMRGDELLRHIQILSQRTLKIMLTGQANIEGVTNAVNEADLYRFISKPWDSSHLVQIVRVAVRDYLLEKEKEDRGRALLEVSPDLVFFIRRDGLVLDFRGPAEGEAGTPSGYAGKRLEEIFPPEIAAVFSGKIAALPRHGGCVSFEYHLPAGPLWRHFETRLTSCGQDAVLAVARDVSPSKESERALRAAITEAELANNAKSSFLAAMSHEIRTPLNAVVGFSNLLMDTSLDPEQREFADTINKSADTLLSVVNDILDFSKIEAGRIELEKASFDLREAVEDCLEMVAPEANRKGLEICDLIAEKCPDHVIGDVTRLRQVLTNLLSNAVKFTERGEVDVSVEALEPAEPGTVPVRFRVRDTGIGMSEEQQRKVFQPFIQADASTTRRFGGTGLGLAISGRLVELMGGTISVVSRPGEGSTFSFTIPLEPDSATSSGQPRETPQPQLANLRVALVDDNATNRRYLGLQLKSWGASTTPFETGAAFLRFLEEGGRCDLVLMDYHMPEMDGLAVAQAMRAIPRFHQVPIVLLSSGGLPFQKISPGLFARVFTKPVNPRLLRNALAVLAGSGEPEISAGLPSDMAANQPLRILLAEDNPSNQKLLSLVLGRMGYQADVASNGHEVLAAMRLHPYDVVLMDVQMPEMDGLQATKRIRSEFPADLQPTIIALTAHASETDRLLCLEAGMNGYLTKPLRPNSWPMLSSGPTSAGSPATNAEPARLPIPRNGIFFALPPECLHIASVDDKSFLIRYRFDFSGGDSKEFLMELEKPGLHMRARPAAALPDWTRLSHQKCPNCPLSEARHPHCPIAANLAGVVEAFAGVISHGEADVEVATESRTYSARVNITHAVGSLIGIFMATSGCPIMDRLKPMVLTHLPFPTTDESIYRSISMYFMAQYFRSKNGLGADWNLEKLPGFFEDIHLVNQSFVKRLTSFVEKDVSLNAVVLLNCFAMAAKRLVAKERFEEFEQLFEAHLEGAGKN